jgi:anaerobic magnesium-protoporphyrin IX monomethyl ester cyclase
MRILLIDPPFYRFMGFYNRYFPVGLASIATVLRNAGHEAFVYDADFNERPSLLDYTRLPEHYERYLAALRDPDHPILAEVRETIRRIGPELVGISIWTTFAAAAFRVAEISKSLLPGCPVVMGGPHATAKSEEVLRICPAVDYVIEGEGEQAALEFAAALAGGRLDPAAIHGLAWREQGGIRRAPPREGRRDLDGFPFPDRELLMNRDRYTPEDMGLIMTSRGCPYACTYCATDVRRTSYRSVGHVLEEIEAVRYRYGTVQFSFKDDSFTVNRGRIEELCERMIAERLPIHWECTTRVNLVTEDLLRKMKRAGCNSVKIGIESGSVDVLARMNKQITLEQVRQAGRLLRRIGTHWTGYFLIGTPGEKREDVHKTLEFLHEIRPDFASLGVYEPFPGTAMFEDGIRRGLVKRDMDLQDFYDTLPNHYYKADARRQVETMEPEQFTALEQKMKDVFHRYNKHPVRILRRAKARVGQYRQAPRALYADFKKYLSWR